MKIRHANEVRNYSITQTDSYGWHVENYGHTETGAVELGPNMEGLILYFEFWMLGGVIIHSREKR